MVSNEPEYCDYDGMSALSCGIKRIFDAAVSLFGLIVTSPFFLLIYVLIKREDGGPAIFKQERVGYKGELFTLYKLERAEGRHELRGATSRTQVLC